MLTCWSRERGLHVSVAQLQAERHVYRWWTVESQLIRGSVDAGPQMVADSRLEWVLRLIGGARRVALMRVRAEIFKFWLDRRAQNLRRPVSRFTVCVRERTQVSLCWFRLESEADRVSGLMKANSQGLSNSGPLLRLLTSPRYKQTREIRITDDLSLISRPQDL